MRRGLDKQAVLQAAATLADEVGYGQLSLALLAKQLHIRTPSLYNHVDGMTGLKQELAAYALRKLKEALVDAVLGTSGDDALHALALGYVTFARQHPGIYEATMGASDPREANFQAAATDIVKLIERLMKPYQLDGDTVVHAVRGLRSIVHGFASLELQSEFNMDVNRDESLRFAVQTYLTGLGNT